MRVRIKPESIYSADIDHKNRATLAEVLCNYDLQVYSIDKARSAYKICADKGAFCLKRVSHGYEKAKKSYYLMKYLRENGWDNIAEFYYTKEGKAIVRHKGSAFYITRWIDGRETNLSEPKEILACAELLADFHSNAKGFDAPMSLNVKSHAKKWRKTFNKCLNELRKFSKHIDKLSIKAEFDYEYKNNIEYFLEEAELAVKVLDRSKYNIISEYYANERYICHDSYYYQNILVDKNGKLYLVDLESCQIDMPVSDLGKFIRRLLSRKKFRWDFDLCRKMIESYCNIRPMSVEEYEILLAMMIFPHKFWKLGKKRYIKNKKWSEDKFNKKLKRLIRDKQYKREFIYCYMSFYNLGMDNGSCGISETCTTIPEQQGHLQR